MNRAFAGTAMLLALSACSAGTSSVPLPRTSTATPAPTANPGFRAPQVMRGNGLDGIVGQNASALLDRFGVARIDLAEGDARKLQFASEACVLDIYLYPLAANGELVATHIAVRERSNGGAIDRTACIADVEQSAGVG